VALDYAWDPQRSTFVHQYDRDLQLLVVWSNGRAHDDAVLDIVRRELTVIAQLEVAWSPSLAVRNFERLYGQALTGAFGKHREAGDGPFLLLVLEDPDPRYGYAANVSGMVELTNLTMARVKAEARAVTGGYLVHSSNNLREFFRDATTILGAERLDAVLAGEAEATDGDRLGLDPPGSHGWDSLEQLLTTVRRMSPYVVLRGFEGLPAVPPDAEIDLLCADLDELVAAVGGREVYPGPAGSAYSVEVDGATVHLDVREAGDGYLPERWQRGILARREWRQGVVAVPRVDDHFFSLLYHAVLQKPSVKPAYVPLLRSLAEQVGLSGPTASRITEPERAAAVLDGYLAAQGLAVPRPRDRGVHRNEDVERLLTLSGVEPSLVRQAAEESWRRARSSEMASRLARVPGVRGLYRAVRGAVRR
jgi:hypothetical protein